ILLSVTCPSLVLAWGFHDALEYGSPLTCVTPKSTAMGGVWSLPSSGPASIFLNPAELYTLDGTEITVGTGLVQWHSYVHGELGFEHHDSGMVLGTFTAAAGTRISDAVSIGAGISRISDFGFEGVNKLIDNTGFGLYEIIAIDILDSRGTLSELNGGVSVELADWLKAGASGGLRFGTGSWTMIHTINDESTPDDTTSEDWKESDFCAHIGFLMPFEFGTFGISGTNSSDRYRSRVAVGFQKDFEILFGSTLGVEFDIQSIENEPEISGRFFGYMAEILPHTRSIYSVGFSRPSNYHRTALSISTGACIDFDRLGIDLTISWKSRSRDGHSFADNWIAHIDDSGTYYSVGMNWKL
ncbi:MAG: hypothetical protein KAQ97_01060, partial [Candidatus Fermentibacteraceae bacterium]|nr:hypothetical protein [Candidatus Fermentibacteraceae bacterium]